MSSGDLENQIQPLYLILHAHAICLQETVEEASIAYNDLGKYEPWRFDYFASAAVLRVAVAVARYRVDRQRLPETLIDLVPDYLPEVPRDPFAKMTPSDITTRRIGLLSRVAVTM